MGERCGQQMIPQETDCTLEQHWAHSLGRAAFGDEGLFQDI